jgi:4-amino-4-deoxy-L-arabinose transferase-like glycosyltransferase
MGEGNRGLLRFLNFDLYCSFSWLLPFALIGLFAWSRRPTALSLAGLREVGIFSEKGITLIALCFWLLPGLLYFSFTPGFWNLYYLATIAPPLAGLVGIGAVAMYREYRGDRITGWLLVAAVLVTGLVQVWEVYRLFIYDPLGYGLLLAVVLAGCTLCSGILVWLRAKKMSWVNRCSVYVACIAVAVLFVAPVVWSCDPFMSGSAQDHTDPALIAFLLSHDDNKTYLAAVPFNGAMVGSLILDTGRPVMALGGFSGRDQILPVEKMHELIHNGTVGYVIVPPGNPTITTMTNSIDGNAAIFSWVTDHCTEVPASEWSERRDYRLSQYALYDCAGAV